MAGANSPGRTPGLCRDGGDGNARSSLHEPVALALELLHRAVVHEAVQDGAGHGDVAPVLSLILHGPVGGHHDGSAQLVALVHDGLQNLCGVPADALGQEKVIEHEQVRCGPTLLRPLELRSMVSGSATTHSVLLVVCILLGWQGIRYRNLFQKFEIVRR